MNCDVVYVLGTASCWGDNELRYSLRSIAQYVENFGRVYVVGHQPRWLTNVVHLPYPDKYVCKERNIMEKLAYACGHPDLSKTFLHVHDDHLALSPVRAQEIPFWAGTTLDILATRVNQKNHWRDAVLNTSKALIAKGLTNFNFDLHYPMLFDKDLYPVVMDQYDWRGSPRGFVVKSLYANTMKVQPTHINDLKLSGNFTMTELVARLRGRPWFSLGANMPNIPLRDLLQALYPTPSPFELM